MRIVSSAASLSFLAVAVACGGGGGSEEGEVSGLLAPMTVTQVPSPGDPNVWARAPITVSFSRPIAPPADDSVVLALDGGRVIPATARLSWDRKTLTIDPDALPPPRSEVTVVFRKPILERPGKAVEIPDWTFTVPQWQLLAPPLQTGGDGYTSVELAAASDGNVFLASQFSLDGFFGSGVVLQASPGAWTELGAPESPGGTLVIGLPVIVDGTGAPVTARRNYAGVLDVERYADSGWRPLGSLPSTDSSSVTPESVRLTLDSADRPVVGWADIVGGAPEIRLARWSGTAWESLGSVLPASPSAFDLASGPDGKVGVAFTDRSRLVLAETGALEGASTPSGCNEVSATFDPDGLVAACSDSAGTIRVFRVARDYGVPRLYEVGPSPSAAGHHVAIRYRPTGAPDARLVLAFLEATGPRVLGWNGQSWVSISQEIATPGLPLYQEADTASRSLAVSARGELVYGWAEVVGLYKLAYYVARYND